MSKKYVDKKVSAEIHEKAAPFINWLKEAEEDESEEEEEDNVEVRGIQVRYQRLSWKHFCLILKTSNVDCIFQVVYSNFEKVGQQEVPKPTKEAPPEEEEDDDLDIDDI